MREKDGNHLVPDPDYMLDALKLPNQAPIVSGDSLQTCMAWRCPDGTQHLFCWPNLTEPVICIDRRAALNKELFQTKNNSDSLRIASQDREQSPDKHGINVAGKLGISSNPLER
ncbi:hypothetical protein TNCV_2608801 [Trichonephila clavipes]|uniref:Uncharacterized protein n=1 Tax=Trichonephila clavipes TaxID=2585209 RepID=A0A8X6RTW3_TRICX|nr:hypothetical protein TNCV_2608801 [Trichonephila clavipes]